MLIYKYIGVVFFLFLISCNLSEQESQEKQIHDYFSALNNGSFKEVSNNINDSIVIAEGEFILARSVNDLRIHFKWDSVFKPHYKVIELITADKSTEAIISKTCKRIRFLHDSAIVYKVTVDFKENKICKMETVDYKVFDFAKWQSRRDTLVRWMDENHPELSGFITDQTVTGAQNYLKAIELYNAK